MTPFYQDDNVTLYHGDSLDVLQHLGQFDLLLTDPPYGIGESSKKRETRGKLAPTVDYGEFNWDESTPSGELIAQARAHAKHQIIFGGNYFDLPPSSCWLVWDKDNGANDFSDCELAWTNLPKAVRRFLWRWNGMLQQDMGDKEKRVHPSQKPLALMRWCIGQVPHTKTILDPFSGGGSTLVAAKQLGLKAVGIERDERYCKVAAERIAATVQQLSLFTHQVEVPK